MDKLSLNNEVILMRKSLKSIHNQTKLNLFKKIKKLKQNEKTAKSASRKESELEALKRLKLSDVKLHEAVNSEKLQKILTSPTSSEIDRANARILLNPIIQKNVQKWNSKFGPETVETFLTSNHENIKKGKETKSKRAKNKKSKKVVKTEKKVKESTKVDGDEEDVEEENDDDDMSSNEDSEVDDERSPRVDSEDDDYSEKSDIEESTEIETKPEITSVQKRLSEMAKNIPPPKKSRRMEIVKTSDPFFVNSSGENYVASITTTGGNDSEDDDRPKSQFSREKRFPQRQTFVKKPIKSKRFDETPPARSSFIKKDQPIAKNFVAEKPSKPSKPPQNPTKSEDIHPSWKAKAEMKKQQMAGFQGTKIKFDE